MKKSFTLFCCILLISSCMKIHTANNENAAAKNDVEHFLTSEEFEVPVKEGYVTKVVMGGETIAEAVSPMTILIPRYTATKSGVQGPELFYTPLDEYPNNITPVNTSKLYQVVCFEDSKKGDYDYNDFVIHVSYRIHGNIFGFGVQPIALGSTKPIKLGCSVYKGDYLIYKGLITPDGKDCREQYFESQKGFINTVGTTINQQNGGWPSYLGSTCRNWQIDKYPGNGAMRVEWYIEVDNGLELYALSTAHPDKSLDSDLIPYGMVITNTGSTYIDDKGNVCGHDWFNYPQESVSLEKVYPELWQWLTGKKSLDFGDFYDQYNIPENAFPASDLGLYHATDVNVWEVRFSMDRRP